MKKNYFVGSLVAVMIFIMGAFTPASAQTTLGGVNLGHLTDYLFVFTNGSVDANWQGATKGFIGDVAIDGNLASERTSGNVPYAGTIYTNSNSMGQFLNIVNSNSGQAFKYLNETSRIASLETDFNNAMTQIKSLSATSGYTSVSSASLNNLSTQNGIAETFVINITSGLQISSQINISGDANDIFILRWDTDGNPSNGYQGQVKFQSGGAIVPNGGLKATNFINVAGDLSCSGGGGNPPAPYPQGPRNNDGTGALITGGADFSGGGFFTGYWLTTGDPSNGETSPFSNGIFVGGWYTSTTKFSMTSGTSGVHITPPSILSTLPIKLINFTAAAINKNTIDIKWNTATEDGTEKYILERSTNGINFSAVYNISSARASNESNYGYRDDVTGLSNTIYYRVKIYLHFDLYSISKVVKINSKSDLTHCYILSVIQNGNKTNPVVNLYSTTNGYVSLQVVDIDGKILFKIQPAAAVGLNAIELPANRINTIGIKFIQLTIQQEKLNYKFLFH